MSPGVLFVATCLGLALLVALGRRALRRVLGDPLGCPPAWHQEDRSVSHWSETADRVYAGRMLVAEDDDGDWWVRVPHTPDIFRRWSPWRPSDWLRLAVSRIRRRLIVVERWR